SGGLVEVQGTGEGGTFSRAQLRELLDLAERGLDRLGEIQRRALGAAWPLDDRPEGPHAGGSSA
ncbi:MAG TPA: hypothetical protein VF590_11240, partial [Isosphaeraceae bacterium]